jgi:aspartate carbamoyltransferase catalytic subunit
MKVLPKDAIIMHPLPRVDEVCSARPAPLLRF